MVEVMENSGLRRYTLLRIRKLNYLNSAQRKANERSNVFFILSTIVSITVE
jgi:hypothetical protein